MLTDRCAQLRILVVCDCRAASRLLRTGLLASVGSGGSSLTMRFAGALPAPELSGPRATYRQVSPGVDLIVEATRTGFESFFVLTARPRLGAEPDLRLSVALSGATARGAANGAVEFVAADGSTVLGSMPGASVWDASVDSERQHPLGTPWKLTSADRRTAPPAPPVDATSTVPTGTSTPLTGTTATPRAPSPPSAVTGLLGTAFDAVAHSGGASRLRPVPAGAAVRSAQLVALDVRPDVAFLQDPRVRFPVVVDPELTLRAGFNTWVDTSFNSDQSGSTELRLGNYGGGVARSWLNVDVSAIAGARIAFAQVYLWNWHSWSCSPRPWQVWSADPASTASTWVNQPTRYTMWSQSSQTAGYDASCGANYVNTDVTGLFQAYADGRYGYTGLALTAQDEGDVYGWKRFNSANAASAVPGIYVNYRNDCNSYTGPAGRHWVCGSILTRYQQLGEAAGSMGPPVTEEIAADGGWYNDFTSGGMTHTIAASPSTGAWEVRGAIRGRGLDGRHAQCAGVPDHRGERGGRTGTTTTSPVTAGRCTSPVRPARGTFKAPSGTTTARWARNGPAWVTRPPGSTPSPTAGRTTSRTASGSDTSMDKAPPPPAAAPIHLREPPRRPDQRHGDGGRHPGDNQLDATKLKRRSGD